MNDTAIEAPEPDAFDLPRTKLPFEGGDSHLLDCIEDNVAVLLRHAGVSEVRTPFACEWHFAFTVERPMPSLHRSTLDARVERFTARRLRRATLAEDCVEQCRRLLPEAQALLLFGDAYFMPWLPYFGADHLEHSFLVDAVSNDGHVRVVDAYCNRTEWGDARPVEAWVPARALAKIVGALQTENRGHFITLEPLSHSRSVSAEEVLRDNARHMLRALSGEDALRAFATYYDSRAEEAASVKQFVLACWLAVRSRALHGLWLWDVSRAHPELLPPGFAERFRLEVLRPWERVNEFAYVLWRRISQGKRAVRSCFELLANGVHVGEWTLARELSAHLEGTARSVATC
jgi:hypothetical protein